MITNIFVFGSNLAGWHGAGSALEAFRNHGAVRGIGEDLTGRAYTIPTKDKALRTLPLGKIRKAVNRFLTFAHGHPDLVFSVVKIGCGLAGYQEEQIAPMFRGATVNVNLPEGWER